MKCPVQTSDIAFFSMELRNTKAVAISVVLPRPDHVRFRQKRQVKHLLLLCLCRIHISRLLTKNNKMWYFYSSFYLPLLCKISSFIAFPNILLLAPFMFLRTSFLSFQCVPEAEVPSYWYRADEDRSSAIQIQTVSTSCENVKIWFSYAIGTDILEAS